jgi:precorrin-4/cobalt-precorrin-4 C11-methyltransferase
MMSLYRKTKWIMITVAIMVIATLGAAPHAFAGQADQTRLYLVSLGVGDVDLITLRAIDTINKSQVIVCRKETENKFIKYLKGKEILDASLSGWRTYRKDRAVIKDRKDRKEREKQDTKERERRRNNNETRAKLIAQIRHALDAGKTVSVLGSGDLCIYGGPYRWYLEEFKDMHPKIIPGVSCFNAANAALGKDVMLGKQSHSAVLTTARDLEKFSDHHPTMVIFTMHTQFEDLVEKLKTQYSPETPIAIVFYAGYKDKEHITRGRLDTILQKTQGHDFPFEHLVYVGDFMN